MRSAKKVKAGSENNPTVINVWGKKDPRGWDNTITIWVNDKNELIIQLEKPSPRCYSFDRIEQNNQFIKIISKG
jgi:hypothetical protein